MVEELHEGYLAHKTDTTSMLPRCSYTSFRGCSTKMRHFRTHSSTTSIASLLWRVLCCTAACLGIVLFAAAAQVSAPVPVAEPAADPLPFTNQYQGEYFTTDLTEVFRLRHIEGEGQGGVDAYTNFGFTKFAWMDNGVLMFDVTGRFTNEADPGVTGGIHRRTIVGDLIIGTGIFYDWQEFSQGSVAIEIFSPNWALRSNGYAVIGNDVDRDVEYETTGTTNIFFEGNNIVADGLSLHEEYDVAMSGADVELARQLGVRATEVFIGGYFYGGEMGEEAVGGKGGVRGFIVPDVAASLSVSSDDVFGTNVFGGLTWFVGARGGLSRPNIAQRMLIPVERNEQVVVSEVEQVTPVAGSVVLTEGDDPIVVVHVQSGAAGLNDGTFENPFNALPATQEADIVYLHGGSAFAGQSYVMAIDQRLLGEGNGNLHFVDTSELGDILLPAGSGGANRPIIQAAPGNAVTLAAEGSEVSNLSILNAVGTGIIGTGVNEFDINRNEIIGSGARGIFLNNITGTADTLGIASGDVDDNVVTDSAQQNIQIVLASDYEGDVTGNTANTSNNAEGIRINGSFRMLGDVSNNTANGNASEGIDISLDEFVGEVSGNTANNNQTSGLLLTLDIFDGDITGNTTNANLQNGIALSLNGDFFSDADITGNAANNNTAEGIRLLFSGTGTSLVEVLNNNLSGNNGGIGREFVASNEDVAGNAPVTFIELDGNTSTNALGAGPPFNYEFENEDLFSDGEMTVDLGTNTGTVGIGEGVELGDSP
jgi:hypothetical protein